MTFQMQSCFICNKTMSKFLHSLHETTHRNFAAVPRRNGTAGVCTVGLQRAEEKLKKYAALQIHLYVCCVGS
jgi:hypothetical protein